MVRVKEVGLGWVGLGWKGRAQSGRRVKCRDHAWRMLRKRKGSSPFAKSSFDKIGAVPRSITTECVTFGRMPRFREERPFFEIAVVPIGTAVFLWS